MIESNEFPPIFWWCIHKHFGEQMFMNLTYDTDFEKTYQDNHITIIFSVVSNDMTIRSSSNNKEYIKLRINIKNWKNKSGFSSTYDVYDTSNVVSEIYYRVSQSGGDSRDILNDWKELKKPEIRDLKLGELGI